MSILYYLIRLLSNDNVFSLINELNVLPSCLGTVVSSAAGLFALCAVVCAIHSFIHSPGNSALGTCSLLLVAPATHINVGSHANTVYIDLSFTVADNNKNCSSRSSSK